MIIIASEAVREDGQLHLGRSSALPRFDIKGYVVTDSTYCTWMVKYLRIRTPMRRSGPAKGLTELHPALALSYTGPLIAIKRTLISTIRSLIGSHLFRRQVSH